MLIWSYKMKMMMKPNLYASLDMIPEIGTNRSIQRLKTTLKKVFYNTNYVKNGPKWLGNVETIGKRVKSFKYLKIFQ